MSSVPTPFPNTRWTLLQQLRSGSDKDARAALETLCKAYWFPLYAVARFRQMSEHDAQDAVQGLFESLLRRETFRTADPARGRLRNLLLKAFEHYCLHEWRKGQRQRRGSGAEHVELAQVQLAEQRYLRGAHPPGATIEAVYDREWARAVMDRSLEVLRQHYYERGHVERFDMLSQPLLLDSDDASLESLAAEAGMTHGAFRTALHRLRSQYREFIERELAATLDTDDPTVIKEEIRELFRALG